MSLGPCRKVMFNVGNNHLYAGYSKLTVFLPALSWNESVRLSVVAVVSKSAGRDDGEKEGERTMVRSARPRENDDDDVHY